MPSLNFDEERLRFREWFEENHGLLSRAVTAYRGLLSQMLADHTGFATPIVTGRLKARDECIGKFSRKYQGKCEADQTPYVIKDYLTDIIGVRVVCLYETDVPKVREIVVEHFDVIEESDKSASIEYHDDTFGYKGLHLDLKLKENRAALPEYARFKDVQFELQIRTTVQDAWSVLDHKIKYKKNIPDSLRRMGISHQTGRSFRSIPAGCFARFRPVVSEHSGPPLQGLSR